MKKLYSELNQSEARREQAEREAAYAAEKMMRLTDVTSQMEETKKENENLSTQVLQNVTLPFVCFFLALEDIIPWCFPYSHSVLLPPFAELNEDIVHLS